MLKIVTINFIVLVVLVVGLEFVVGLYVNMGKDETPIVEEKSQEYIQTDEALGFKSIPGAIAQSKKSKGAEIIFDVLYSFDEYGRRVTPQADSMPKKSHIVVLGDSNTFGEGLNDDETISYFLGRSFPTHRIYNYAFRGYGPGNSLALSETNRLSKEVLEEKGLVLFFFMTSHASRLIGSLPIFRWSEGWHPYYEMDKDGILVRNGTFKSAQPVLSWLKRTFARSNIYDLFDINYPDPYSAKNLNKLCQSFYQMKKNVSSQLPGSQFLIVIWGGASVNAKKVARCLNAREIPFVDLMGARKRAPVDSDLHPLDGHYNQKIHLFYSKELSIKLLERGLIRL